jgi:pimeloyl-ACP methyl ester carboxylesterase
MRIANHTRDQVAQVAEQLIACTPGIFRRLARYSATIHVADKDTMLDAMNVSVTDPLDPATHQCAGSSTLFRQYTPVLFHWIRRTLYHAGTIAMRRVGYTSRIHATEIGDYTVWSHIVPESKPIVMFPGFGLGAVPYHGVMTQFGRTVHIIELPNLGHNTPQNAPGYMTGDTIYRVVRNHVGDEPHDIVAHSLGSPQAAHYINYQHTTHTTPPDQTAVICDGFVCPVDGYISHIYPFVDYPMYREMMRHREKPFSWFEFSNFLRFASHDLNLQVFAKRFHNFYEGVLWRDDYETTIRYVFGERDMLYDVPYIQSVVSKSYVERKKYLFLPKARHGACFFGKRRNETLVHIGDMLSPTTPGSATPVHDPVPGLC